MTLRDRALALGIDPDDPKYARLRPYSGLNPCPWCLRHGDDEFRLLCDVQQIEYALLDPATRKKCYRCKGPHTETEPLCPTCEDLAAAHHADNERRESGHPRRRGSAYMSDGHGCVERASFAERFYYPGWFR